MNVCTVCFPTFLTFPVTDGAPQAQPVYCRRGTVFWSFIYGRRTSLYSNIAVGCKHGFTWKKREKFLAYPRTGEAIMLLLKPICNMWCLQTCQFFFGVRKLFSQVQNRLSILPLPRRKNKENSPKLCRLCDQTASSSWFRALCRIYKDVLTNWTRDKTNCNLIEVPLVLRFSRFSRGAPKRWKKCRAHGSLYCLSLF